MLKLDSGGKLKGSLVIRTYKAGTKELLRETRVENLIVSGSGGYGRNLVIRALAGDGTYGIAIDSADIGTGSTTPADSDTALASPAGLSASFISGGISVGNDSAIFSWFIADANLPNDTYREFGMFIGGRLFSRALITPAHVKATGEDTSVDYTISLTS